MPKWFVDLWTVVGDGFSYDLVKIALGSIVVAAAGSFIGKYTKRLESLRETIYVAFALFVGTFVVVSMISPRTQIPQLAGNVEGMVAGPLNGNKDTISVITISILNQGTMQSITKNWTITATINSINYQGAFITPAPPSFTFTNPNADPNTPTAITYHGVDNLLEKAAIPVPPGGETEGLLFVIFHGIDPDIFKAGAEYTIGYEDALSKSYSIHATSSAQRGPIPVTPGIHSELACPVPPATPNMSTGTLPKL